MGCRNATYCRASAPTQSASPDRPLPPTTIQPADVTLVQSLHTLPEPPASKGLLSQTTMRVAPLRPIHKPGSPMPATKPAVSARARHTRSPPTPASCTQTHNLWQLRKHHSATKLPVCLWPIPVRAGRPWPPKYSLLESNAARPHVINPRQPGNPTHKKSQPHSCGEDSGRSGLHTARKAPKRA